MLPTIAEAAGLPAPANVHGRSLLPLLSGAQEAVRGHVFSELHYPGGPFYGLSDGTWKLARYGPGEVQLFHLPSDAEERHNLIAQAPDEAARLGALLAAPTPAP